MGISVFDREQPLLLGGKLRTVDGRARAELTQDGRGLRVSHGRQLVLELRPEQGVLVLDVPQGDLQLRADRGTVSLVAQEVNTSAKRVATTADEISWRTGSWRLSAAHIRQRADSMVTVVRGSLQTRAKQVRVVAKGMFQLLSERTSLRSKDNTAIDGKRVLLG